MPVSEILRTRQFRFVCRALYAVLFAAGTALCSAATIHGVVTDGSGAKITGANVVLISNGKPVGSTVSTADGSFQVTTGANGRFFLVVASKNFRELQTPDFYAGQFDAIERNIVLEPAWVRESIVVTATGTPTPQSQTSSATTVLGPLDLALRENLVSALRLMPGTSVVQSGQRGGQTSLFIRGGDPSNNKILLDGVNAGDLGGQFDFGMLSTTAIESAEVYRGPDSNLYGADAESGVVSLTTPHGTTSFPSLIFEGNAGNFNTSNERLELSGAHKKLDYLGAFNWFQTSNALPRDEYHLATTAANVGWALNGNTQIRATLHYGVDGTGVPNAWEFYHVADDATQKDQDTYLSVAIDNQTTPGFHNSVRYGLTRKREQENLWQNEGNPISYTSACYGPGTLGNTVTIIGANGAPATGQAVLDCSPYALQYVSNRDQLMYHGDVTITPHLTALIGFQYENERGAEPGSSSYYYPPVERTNYDYIAAVHGDFKERFFYTLGGSVEHYSLFGVETSPRAGLSVYAFRPRKGVFSSTRVLFNYGQAVREPKLTDQDYSLYTLLQENDDQAEIQQFKIMPLAAPAARTYEGGIEQTFLDQHIVFRTSYFHNEFTNGLEFVGTGTLIELFPNLAPLATFLNNYSGGATLNSQAFRAQGIESTVESGIGRNIFLRGGYTYLDAVTQHSFDSDNAALIGGYAPTYNGILIGANSPLVGARPFRRPPHTGYFSATWASRRLTGVFTSSFASRSDDSTFLGGDDASGSNSNGLLLPNRNLDHGYAKLDLGGSYQLFTWMDIYAQAENLLSEQHIAPIGYVSLPMNFRTGLRIQWGIGSGH
jgi:vitamin B12 transporter